MKINFSKRIYSKKAVQKAANNFSNLANFKIEEKQKKIEVVLSQIDEDLKDVIKEELSNHVLAYMKNLNSGKQNE
ncbi:MAG: HxsD-like protein [Candidatus Woesearchaeota archaeon]